MASLNPYAVLISEEEDSASEKAITRNEKQRSAKKAVKADSLEITKNLNEKNQHTGNRFSAALFSGNRNNQQRYERISQYDDRRDGHQVVNERASTVNKGQKFGEARRNSIELRNRSLPNNPIAAKNFIEESLTGEKVPELEVDHCITLEEFQAKLKVEREAAAKVFGAVKEKVVDESEFDHAKLRIKSNIISEDSSRTLHSGGGDKKSKTKKIKQTFVDVGFCTPPIEPTTIRNRGYERSERPPRIPISRPFHQNINIRDESSFPKL